MPRPSSRVDSDGDLRGSRPLGRPNLGRGFRRTTGSIADEDCETLPRNRSMTGTVPVLQLRSRCFGLRPVVVSVTSHSDHYGDDGHGRLSTHPIAHARTPRLDTGAPGDRCAGDPSRVVGRATTGVRCPARHRWGGFGSVSPMRIAIALESRALVAASGVEFLVGIGPAATGSRGKRRGRGARTEPVANGGPERPQRPDVVARTTGPGGGRFHRADVPSERLWLVLLRPSRNKPAYSNCAS